RWRTAPAKNDRAGFSLPSMPGKLRACLSGVNRFSSTKREKLISGRKIACCAHMSRRVSRETESGVARTPDFQAAINGVFPDLDSPLFHVNPPPECSRRDVSAHPLAGSREERRDRLSTACFS